MFSANSIINFNSLSTHHFFKDSDLSKNDLSKTAISELWRHAETSGEMRDLFFSFIDSPTSFCFSNGNNDYVLEPLDFYECECVCADESPYTRYAKSLRSDFESAILSDISNRFPEKNYPLHLLSLGSGGLLQDFIIIGKLIQRGYLNITLSCVDLFLDFDRALKFENFFKTYFPEVNFTLLPYKDITDMPSTSIDLAHAIDYTGFFDAFTQTDPSFSINPLSIERQKKYFLPSAKCDDNPHHSSMEDFIQARSLLKDDAPFFLGVGPVTALKFLDSNKISFMDSKFSLVNEEVFASASESVDLILDFTDPQCAFIVLSNFIARGCENVRVYMKRKNEWGVESNVPIFVQKLFPRLLDQITVILVDEFSEVEEPVYATFYDNSIDTHETIKNLSEYSIDIDECFSRNFQ